MRNLLFILYHDFTSNSAVQVHSLANELCAEGWDCVVAIDGDLASVDHLGTLRYRPCTHAQVLAQDGRLFRKGRGPDIIHAWTPREKVRKLCAALDARSEARLIIHLEDNEEELLASAFKQPFRQLHALSEEELDAVLPEHLSHPRRYRQFLASADGATLLIETLADFVPAGVPTCTFWPAADASLFYPRPTDRARRRELNIPDGHTVLVYTGNVHAANHREVRSLYLAVALLNREGYPTTLVRAGRDFYPFLGEGELGRWCDEYVVHLGQLAHEEIPAVLALADVLVQPGLPDHFNNYRFPSKLPEFFAMGKPIVLPAANVGLHVEHRKHAFVLPRADALGIAGAVAKIVADAELAGQLTHGAQELAATHFSWKTSAAQVSAFYQRQLVVHRPQTTNLTAPPASSFLATATL